MQSAGGTSRCFGGTWVMPRQFGIINGMCRFALQSCVLLLLAPSLLRAAPDVSFADMAAARAAIVDDPAYFDRMQPMEMEAKTGQPLTAATLDEKRAECRRRYQAAAGEFTDEEKTAI